MDLFGGNEKGIKQLITLMYCFRGDLPNLANIVGKYCRGGGVQSMIGRYLHALHGCLVPTHVSGFIQGPDNKTETISPFD